MTVLAFSHVTLNCSDFNRSLSFLRDRVGLPVAKQLPRRHNTGVALGLATPHSSETAVLAPGRGEPAIELIEWRLPAPTAPPRTPHTPSGLHTIRLTSHEPSAAGQLLDPDGVVVEVQSAASAGLTGVVALTVDVETTADFYKQTLGLGLDAALDHVTADGSRWKQRTLNDLSPPTLSIDFREPIDQPVSPVTERHAGAVGLLRLAFSVDEVRPHAANAQRVGARMLTPPQTFELGNLTVEAAMWFDPDGVLVEVVSFR